MNIILLGAPGAGKGTQGQLLSRSLKIPWLSIGELFRQEIAGNTPEGKKLNEFVSLGLNVPSGLAIEVLDKNLKKHQKGFILDNYPRSIDQLNAFKEYINKSNVHINKTIHLRITKDTSVNRLLKRAKIDEEKNGKARIDETPELIRIRFQTGYLKDIAPILEYFKFMGNLLEINGEDTIENVHNDIMRKIKNDNV